MVMGTKQTIEINKQLAGAISNNKNDNGTTLNSPTERVSQERILESDTAPLRKPVLMQR